MMAKKSPLRSAQVGSMSICGKLLRVGQSITVQASAIGPREQKALARQQLVKRASNKPGFVQLVVV